MDRSLGNLQLSVLHLQVDASGFMLLELSTSCCSLLFYLCGDGLICRSMHCLPFHLISFPLQFKILIGSPCRCRSSCRIEAAVWLPQAQGLGSCIFFCMSKCALLLSCGPGNYGFSVGSMTPNPKAFNNHHLSIIEEPAELAL